MPESQKTDIRQESVFIRYLPNALKPYALLIRMDRPVGTFLLLWPCLWSIFALSNDMLLSAITLKTVLLFVVGAFLMRSAGCIINDLWDRDIDPKVERTALRPLASGTITVKQALFALCVLLLLSLFILLSFNVVTILLGFLALAFVVVYPVMKRFTYWPQLFLGLTFNFGVLMGWAAIDGRLSLSALAFYCAGILWTLGYDTIYAYQDKEDDALLCVKSTALLFKDNGKRWVSGFYTASCLCFLLAGALLSAGGIYYIGTILIYGMYLAKLKSWSITNAADCLKLFKLNMFMGFLLAIPCLTL